MKKFFLILSLGFCFSYSKALECTGVWKHNRGTSNFVFTNNLKAPYANWVRGSISQVNCPSHQLLLPKVEYFMLFNPSYKTSNECYFPPGLVIAVKQSEVQETDSILKISLSHCTENSANEVSCSKEASHVVEVDKVNKTGKFYNIIKNEKLYLTSELKCTF